MVTVTREREGQTQKKFTVADPSQQDLCLTEQDSMHGLRARVKLLQTDAATRHPVQEITDEAQHRHRG